jgi:hypothetical protein
MSRKIVITEEKICEIIHLVLEQSVDLTNYEDEDFFDAYFILFRQWLSKKLGEDVKKYPTSFLLKKYGRKFEKEIGIDNPDTLDDEPENDNLQYHFNRYQIRTLIKSLVDKGKYSLPRIDIEKKFTEKFAKALPSMVERLELPDYVSVEFKEEQPNEVLVKFNIDFPKMVKSTDSLGRSYLNANGLLTKLKSYLHNFLGVDFGNPLYGEVEMETSDINYVGLDEWTKNVLNKKIKKDIKNLPEGPNIQRVNFEVRSGSATMKFVTKSWRNREELRAQIKDYLKRNGYNEKTLQIELS